MFCLFLHTPFNGLGVVPWGGCWGQTWGDPHGVDPILHSGGTEMLNKMSVGTRLEIQVY